MKPKKAPAPPSADRQAKIYAICKKCSPAVFFTFCRVIKEALKCGQDEAEKEVINLVKSGRLKQINANSVHQPPIYEFKN